MSTIVFATGDDLFEHRVRRAFAGSMNGNVSTWDANQLTGDPVRAAEDIVRADPDMVAIGPAVPVESALELVRTFDLLHPQVTTMLVAEPTAQLLRHALQAGAREVVSPQSTDEELRDAIDRVVNAATRRRASISKIGTPTVRTGKVICVVSAKGGAGKTTIASNLAVGLGRVAPDEVVIVDLDLQFGDVVTAVRLVQESSILDAVRVGDRLDETMLKAYLTPHERGFYVLAAPERPADADEIDEHASARIVRMLSDVFPYVVVDTGSGLDEHTLALLDVATDIVIVTSTDVPSVRAARKEVETLRALGYDDDRRWHVVLNRADARVGLEADDIQLTIGVPIDIAVPSSRSVPISLNEGTPLLLSDDRSPVARSLMTLAARILGTSAPAVATTASPPAKGGWFRRSSGTGAPDAGPATRGEA
jgi:pilus assembly protein CpaE